MCFLLSTRWGPVILDIAPRPPPLNQLDVSVCRCLQVCTMMRFTQSGRPLQPFALEGILWRADKGSWDSFLAHSPQSGVGFA